MDRNIVHTFVNRNAKKCVHISCPRVHTHIGHGQEYKAIAGFKYGLFIENASTAVKAIKKVETERLSTKILLLSSVKQNPNIKIR